MISGYKIKMISGHKRLSGHKILRISGHKIIKW